MVKDPSCSNTAIKDLLTENPLVDDSFGFLKAKDQNNEDPRKDHKWQDQVTNLKSMIKIKTYLRSIP